MPKTGTISINVWPLAKGATTAIQPIGKSAPTFTTAPIEGETDNLVINGVAYPIRPTMMHPGDIISFLRASGVSDATIDRHGQLSLPSATSVSGTQICNLMGLS